MQDELLTTSDLIELNRNRAAFYRRLAYYYLHELTQAQIEELAQLDFSDADGGDATIAEGYAQMSGSLARINTGTRQQLAVDYAHTFLAAGNYETYAATPYESVFTSEAGILMQEARDEVYKMYCDEQMQPDEKLQIPEDHVAFEFEFMALLLDRLNGALLIDDHPRAAEYATKLQKFHREHQLNWIDDLCDAVEDVANTTFYCGLAKVTRGFVHLETAVIDDELELMETSGKEGAR